MASRLFTIHGDPKLTEGMQAKVTLEIKEHLGSKRNPESILNHRSKTLGRISFLKLQVLHREFTGKTMPAIRFLVTSTRIANQSVKNFKNRIGRA